MTVRSTSLPLKLANDNKLAVVGMFLDEYRSAVDYFISAYWDSVVTNAYSLDQCVLKKKMFYPGTIPDPINSKLSGRAMKAAKTQAMGMINAATAKRAKQAYVLKKLQRSRENTANLQRKISTTPLVKPSVPKNINAEINSINCSLSKSNNTFDYWLELTSMFNKETKKQLGFNSVAIPVNSNRHMNKLLASGKQMNSFLLSKNSVTIRYTLDTPKKAPGTETIAIDQGVTDLLSVSCSDGSSFASTKCPHGHDMASIMQKLSTRTKGTKAFKRAQDHRKNYINWVINQLNLTQVGEIRLEKIHDMRRGKNSGRFLTHFAYPLIERKLQTKCEENGVRFVLQSNEYRSQRCSSCGFVHKNNRKGKTFICQSCGEVHDADINAAENHLVDLPPIDRYAICGLNRTSGFFWDPDAEGIYSSFPKQ